MLEEVLLDREIMKLIDSAEIDWTDDVPDLNSEWAVEQLSPEALNLL